MFYLCGGEPVQWPTLYVELFIEMELEFDFGSASPQRSDEQQNFTDPIFFHGTAQSEVPALFRILTENEDPFNSPNSIVSDRTIQSDGRNSLEWELSTDGGYSYKKLRVEGKILYHEFESWYNSFIVKLTFRPERKPRNRPNRIDAAIYTLPHN